MTRKQLRQVRLRQTTLQRIAAASGATTPPVVQVADAELTLLYDGITDSGRRVQTFLAGTFRGVARPAEEGEVAWADPELLIGIQGAYVNYNLQVLLRLARAVHTA